MADLKDLYTAVVEMQEDSAMDLTRTYLNQNVPAFKIFACYQSALEEIGARFEKQIYFISINGILRPSSVFSLGCHPRRSAAIPLTAGRCQSRCGLDLDRNLPFLNGH